MRTLSLLLAIALVTFSGCTESPTNADPPESPHAGGNETAAPTPAPSGGQGNATGNTANTPPVANLTADAINGTAPLPVQFTVNGTDADGDNLTWVLVVNGTQIANGTEVPSTVNHTFDAGAWNVTLELSDGNESSQTNLVIEVASTAAGPEIFYIHAEGSGDGTMDHTPASGSEGGHGTANLASVPPMLSKSYTATEPTLVAHAQGSAVEAHVQAFSLVPAPQVSMTGTLYADGVAVGTATSAPANVVSVALVTTPCTDWTITFELTADVPAGATLRFDVEGDNLVLMASCYPGGENGPRVSLS